jgi:hypothetical protein
MKPFLSACLGLLWASSLLAQEAPAQEPIDNTVAFQRIEAARAQSMAEFDAEDAQCYQRFAVSGCLKQVQSRRRAKLAELRKQEAALHERERAQQAQEQRRNLAQKAKERQQREEELLTERGADRTAEKLQEQQEKQASHAAKAAVPAASAAAHAASNGPTAAEQASMRESYARKQQDAEKNRQDLARRLAEKKTKPAAPLPLPK